MASMFLVLCVQAIVVQSALGQCLNAAFDGPGGFGPYGVPGRGRVFDGLGFDGLALGAPCGLPTRSRAFDGFVPDNAWPARGLACGSAVDFTPTSGGALPVTSASAIPPTGITILSENVYDGILSVAGEVPFVGTTGMDGIMPTLGVGAINYGCGTGVTAMASDVAAPGYASRGAFTSVAFAPSAAFNPIVFSPAFGPGSSAGITPRFGSCKK